MGNELIAAAVLALAMGLAQQAQSGPQGGPEHLAGGPDPRCPGGVLYEEPPGVAYEPGIDAYGRPVAPASPGQAAVPRIGDEVAFTLKLNPLTEAGLDGDRFDGTELAVTEVEVNLATGALALDGRPVVQGADCARAIRGPMPRAKPMRSVRP